MTFALGSLLVLSFLQPGQGGQEDPKMIGRAREALQTRAQLLHDYSVEVSTRASIETPRGERDFEVRERHYWGGEGEFQVESLSGEAGPRGRGRGFGGMGQQFQRQDPLVDESFLEGATVTGPVDLDGKKVLELKVKPKIEGVRVEKGRLLVDAETGMPLQLELRFGIGAFVSNAELSLKLAFDEDLGITVRREQELRIPSMGFGRFGGGGPPGGGPGFGPPPGGGGLGLEFNTTWQDYQWNLSFSADFFKQPDANQEQAPNARGRRAVAQTRSPTGEEDPFEEIRIAPRGSQGQALGTGRESLTEEVFIEGGSLRRTSGPVLSEGDIVSGLMSGEGGGRFGGRGGLRGARIAGGRANRIQGNASGGISSSALDAKPYALDGTEAPDPSYLTWDAGLSIGGPIGRGGSPAAGFGFGRARRASFFADFNASRGEQLQSQYGAVPTLLERLGDFSETFYTSGPLADAPVQLFDPTSGQEYPGAKLPLDQLNATSMAFLQFIPLPNRSDPFLNYYTQQNLKNDRERLNLRFNLPLTSIFRLSARYGFNQNRGDLFNLFPDLSSDRNGRGQNLNLDVNQVVRPGLIHSFGVSWNRNKNRVLNPFAFNRNVSAEFGIENTSPEPIDYGLTTLQFTNYTALNDGSSSFGVSESNGVRDNLLLVKGNHFFRFGGDLRWRRRNDVSNPDGAGTQTFAGIATSAYRQGNPVPGTGYDFADFLLGLGQASRIQYGNSDHYLRRTEFSLFVDDNWRAASRMTVQWGLRYEFAAPWVEQHDRIANLDVAPDFTSADTVVPGGTGSFFGTYPRALIQSDRNNLAPRIGVAYRLRSGRKASILRANYGVFFPSESYDYLVNELMSQPPFGFTVQRTAVEKAFLEIEKAFQPEEGTTVPNTYGVEPIFRLPTVQNWGVSWQQSLPHNFFVSVGYAGTRGTGLELLRAPNRTKDDGQQTEGTAEFFYLTSGASSVYHGLQILAMRRMRSGFSMSGQYEFGKSLDNASAIGGGQRIVAQNDDQLDSERGRSDFDQRHRLSLNSFWELPFGDRKRWLRDNGFATTLLENWFLRATLTASSGRPFTARVLGNQINNSGTASQASERASVTGDEVQLPRSERSTQQWFNTEGFRLPEPGTFGNAGRNTIDGPGSWEIDLQLAKSVPLGNEGRRFLLLVQMNNLLNHPNYNSLNTVVNSVGFGQVTSISSMRRIQLNFRFMF